ncbi:MAG: NAD(P)/FAD-dependent oxidoreductase, partial [Lachnospiraceae bacterium]|nr:NAD(P)/FAD-dependent oxidoreductase [Lachnospiraceae bacterium]
LKERPLSLVIDLKPALSEEQLDARILREFDAARKKQFKNVLGTLFPAKMIPVMIERSGIPGERPVHEITREERNTLLQLTKHFSLTLVRLRDYNEAIITRGGVSVKEIQPATMESRKVKSLYFAGEVLDVDALTGGFNLQIAWSTGHAAGASV